MAGSCQELPTSIRRFTACSGVWEADGDGGADGGCHVYELLCRPSSGDRRQGSHAGSTRIKAATRTTRMATHVAALWPAFCSGASARGSVPVFRASPSVLISAPSLMSRL